MLVNTDPRETLASAPMSTLQLLAVAITVGLTALDGFDVLSISFASPGIAAEWGIDRAALGVVLSMELMGMALGSIVLGGVADRIGRRRMLIIGAALMAGAGLAFASTGSFLLLAIAGTIGVISPSGNEVRPFLSIRNLTPIFVGARDR